MEQRSFIPPIRPPTAFCAAALLVAWAGAYLDTFLLPMDAASSNALGSPRFAYGVILGIRLAFAGIGSIIFGATYLLSQTKSSALKARRDLLSFASGAAHSVVVFALGRLAVWAGGGAAAVMMWIASLALPIALARRLAAGSLIASTPKR
jgi:hypothetical protein